MDIDFKKYNNLGNKKWDLKYFPDHLFCFSPYFFWFDAVHKNYIIQFHRPYQEIINSDNDRFVVVVVDESFNYIANFYTNNVLLYAETIDMNIYIYTKYLPFYYKENLQEPDQSNVEIFEVKL